MEETCGKTTTEIETQHQGLRVAAEYKRMEETFRGWRYMEQKC
jgi:hypothetical protein